MFDLLDLLLLKRGVPSDDRTMAFRRIDGNPKSKIIYFLPWHTPYRVARQARLVPLDYLACYEMPPAIISSEPELSVQAMRGLAADAQALMAAHGVVSHQAIVIGLSVGSFPATYLANRIGARLCAVASADRADLMLWQSPAARIIKRRAIQKGHRLAHYSKAMLGCHPVQNLAGVRADSVFVVGRRDPFVPPRRSAGLLSAIEQRVRDARVVALDAGHFKTLMASARYQRLFFMENSVRRYWEVRLPKDFAGRRVARPQV